MAKGSCAPSMSKGVKGGNLAKGGKAGKKGFVASPAPMLKKGK